VGGAAKREKKTLELDFPGKKKKNIRKGPKDFRSALAIKYLKKKKLGRKSAPSGPWLKFIRTTHPRKNAVRLGARTSIASNRELGILVREEGQKGAPARKVGVPSGKIVDSGKEKQQKPTKTPLPQHEKSCSSSALSGGVRRGVRTVVKLNKTLPKSPQFLMASFSTAGCKR